MLLATDDRELVEVSHADVLSSGKSQELIFDRLLRMTEFGVSGLTGTVPMLIEMNGERTCWARQSRM